MFNWGDCGANASLVTMLKGYNDPRLPLYFTKNTKPIVKSGAKAIGTDDNGFEIFNESDYLTDPDTGEAQAGNLLSRSAGRLSDRRQAQHVQQLFGMGRNLTMPQPILFAAEGGSCVPRRSCAGIWAARACRRSTRRVSAPRSGTSMPIAPPLLSRGYSEFKQALPDNWSTLASGRDDQCLYQWYVAAARLCRSCNVGLQLGERERPERKVE